MNKKGLCSPSCLSDFQHSLGATVKPLRHFNYSVIKVQRHILFNACVSLHSTTKYHTLGLNPQTLTLSGLQAGRSR